MSGGLTGQPGWFSLQEIGHHLLGPLLTAACLGSSAAFQAWREFDLPFKVLKWSSSFTSQLRDWRPNGEHDSPEVPESSGLPCVCSG